MALDNRSLYGIFDTYSALLQPFSAYAREWAELLNDSKTSPLCSRFFENAPWALRARRGVAAWWALASHFTHVYAKPEWGITETEVDGKTYGIARRVVTKKAFCELIHFEKTGAALGQPKMLVVAPMSGHYATLLRDTVEGLLPHYDVYVTDWINARDVPMAEGGFDLDDYVDYLIDFSRILAPDLHVLAVCQPVVPVFMAACLMSSAKDDKAPASCILIGGPIDTEQSPTEVNELAMDNPITWFQSHVLSMVPSRHKGAMRLVYPGFLQLSGFMSMNPDKHTASIQGAVRKFIEGDFEGARRTGSFYREYFAVMDMTAEFYLQTICSIFKQNRLANGDLLSRGRPVLPNDVTDIGMLAIEGANDDICGRGQTKAALDLCANLPADRKTYHLQEGVGHYGQFSGSKFRKFVVPVIRKFTAAQERAKRPSNANRAKKVA